MISLYSNKINNNLSVCSPNRSIFARTTSECETRTHIRWWCSVIFYMRQCACVVFVSRCCSISSDVPMHRRAHTHAVGRCTYSSHDASIEDRTIHRPLSSACTCKCCTYICCVQIVYPAPASTTKNAWIISCVFFSAVLSRFICIRTYRGAWIRAGYRRKTKQIKQNMNSFYWRSDAGNCDGGGGGGGCSLE